MTASSTILSVSELTSSIKSQLESRFSSLTVQGEISNFKPNSSGHLYFDLKDNQAKISGVMFKRDALALTKMPKEGDHVIVRGALSVYPPHGKYQLVVQKLQFQGLGELLIKLEELKKKLQALGWFDQDKKKPLPKFPKRIGVVTSPTGAVIQDIIHVLSRRHAGFHLILNPVKVQGEGAGQEIAKAIEQFNKYELADVLIVGRGGGSLEDLWAFNEEIVAAAIFNSKIPIISAIGHETDVTIADFVSDVRAPTPSAAAEIVSTATTEHLSFLEKTQRSLHHTLQHLLKRTHERLFRFSSHPMMKIASAFTGIYHQRLDEKQRELDSTIAHYIKGQKIRLSSKEKEKNALQPTLKLKHFHQKLEQFEKRLGVSSQFILTIRKQKMNQIIQTLRSLDPKNVLKRGYSILFDLNEGSVIESAESLTPNQSLRALLKDGQASLNVTKVEIKP